MEPLITDELIARQPPEAQAIIRMLLAKIAKLEAELEELRQQVQGKTPQNSSLPPSTQHPHAKPKPRARKVKIQTQVTAALRPSYDALAARLPAEEQLSIDETPTKEENGKAWLWTFVARTFTVFTVRATREATALSDLLTDAFCGIVNCDRAKMYWRVGRLQWCWAHLKRDFQALIDRGDGQAKRLGYDLRRATCKLFDHWGNYRDGPITRAALQRRMAPIRREVERLLLRGAQSGNPQMQGMCQELYDHRHWLWTFVRHEGVEPTNNASERYVML